MNDYPKYIEVEGKRYLINSDYRVALKIDEIWKDDTIGDYEKILATIYKLFGDEALEDTQHQDKFLSLALKFLRCGMTDEELQNDKEPSMDFKQDASYIKSSFAYCYPQKDLSKYMHWWEFNDLLKGLTEDCSLNNVRYIREESLKGKKGEELQKWIKLKEQVALKREKTAREKELDKQWEELMKKR